MADWLLLPVDPRYFSVCACGHYLALHARACVYCRCTCYLACADARVLSGHAGTAYFGPRIVDVMSIVVRALVRTESKNKEKE
jgi:hypothetical protein